MTTTHRGRFTGGDMERSPYQHKPAYRYIRAADKMPALHTEDGIARIKLFNPTGGQTWYLSEYDQEERLAWGLTDLGPGFDPEYGYVSMEELVGFRGRFGLPLERDLHWRPRPLADCAMT